MEIPIIDFARIVQARPEIARELATISRTSGWVILTNHSIPDENVQQMMGTAQALLDMPGRERWPRSDSLVGYDNSPTRGIDNAFLAGSIGMVFYSANYTEVDMPNGDWAALSDPHGNVLVYLGDVIPFWSRGHLQKMQYRVVESRSDQRGIEKINLAYISTTSPHEMLLH
ncbi:hypothetical protein LTR27_010694 [Elasticomyces elasticus]|nr:hypothetical protein LTR27_010694 [Elasticomyces elasticus]